MFPASPGDIRHATDSFAVVSPFFLARPITGHRLVATLVESYHKNAGCWTLAGMQGGRPVNYYFTVTPEILARDRYHGCGSLIAIGQWYRGDHVREGMSDESAFVAGVVATLSASRPLLLSQVCQIPAIPGGLPSEAFGGEARTGTPVMNLWVDFL